MLCGNRKFRLPVSYNKYTDFLIEVRKSVIPVIVLIYWQIKIKNNLVLIVSFYTLIERKKGCFIRVNSNSKR